MRFGRLAFAATVLMAGALAAQTAAAAGAPDFVLKRPGHLFQTAPGTEKKCFGLTPSLRHRNPYLVAPINEFSGAQSVGKSTLIERAWDWARIVVTNTSYALATGNEYAAGIGRDALLHWAKARAGLNTKVDLRYLGKGNAELYKAQAKAPVLDVEGALDVGWVGLVGTNFIRDKLSAEEFKVLDDWYRTLIEAYGVPFSRLAFRDAGGIWKLLNGAIPLIALAVVDGDQARFRKYATAGLENILRYMRPDGVILKNANRGDRAVHYMSFGILYVMVYAELMQAQDIDAYGAIGDRLHKAVKFMIDADADTAVIKPYAKVGYNNSGRGDNQTTYHRESANHFWWMIVYIDRFPDSPNSPRLRAYLDRYQVLAAEWPATAANCFYRWKAE